jgi:methylenetetrahydrofolate reductase (NADPH)
MNDKRNGAIADAVKSAHALNFSFEFFPPKTPELEEQLWRVIRRLEPLDPRFVSVTYGAGGSTRDRTHRTVSRIVADTGLKPAAHLTCVGATRAQVDDVLRDYWAAGIRHVVALRGDPPAGIGARYEPHPGGYAYAADLVAGALKVAPFEISVACYPETHPDSAGWDVEIDTFKRKLDAGATRGVTQFFFAAETFLRFRDRLAAAGVTAPVSPGIMPVTNFAGARKMAMAAGASIPDWFAQLFDGLDKDPATRQLVAAGQAAELCARLANEGVRDFHFYTLNRAELTIAICRMLGVKTPAPNVEAAA